MDRLILFRHGKAERDSVSGVDFDRPLAPRGARDAAAMARNLADLGLAPNLVLVSPAARTRETWAAAEAAFPGAEVRFEPALYNAEAGGVRHAAERAARATAGALMVIGHNPALQDLAVALLREGGSSPELVAQAERRFPTSAVAVFLIDACGRPAFDGLLTPPRNGD
ncbi:SixA phosphatase family protein [Phenylobacterium sp.]|jgi:phosphohistidine phosphatase|uniref:SixA phosphatase family protein n=1 Tax=Phenylobacterium sp. TaxID=1871053 RepID=UPI002F40FD85